MGHKHNKNWSRRRFLGTTSCAAIGATTFLSTLLDLKLANAMATSSFQPPTNYKSLVCILLAGGNDSFNMLVPRGASEYAQYETIRSSLALANNSLLPLNYTDPNGKQFGVHPAMPEVQQLFNDGNLAFVSNVGTLIEPINKTQFNNGSNLPLGLFSHADQIQQWQTSIPHDRSAIGWGGRMADILQSLNTNQDVSMNISMSGTNVFQAGNQSVSYSVDPYAGVGKTIYEYNNTNNWWDMLRTQAIDSLVDHTYLNIFEQTYSDVIKNSQAASNQFNTAIGGITPIVTPFADNSVSKSFEMIAKTIAARNTLGVCRQTFFITFGGWDHHDEVLDNQTAMLGILSQGLKEFNDSLVELGVENDVVTFTTSDFARTLTSNGNGSDHAWGGNAMVMGNSVNGGTIYGEYPDLVLDNSLDVGRGSLIPTTSADEYFAELALWLGVSPSDLPIILPNITNFYSPSSTPPLGFLL